MVKFNHHSRLFKSSALLGKYAFGQSLKDIRKNKNITLKEMSELTGVQIATISRMENNKMVGALKSYVNIAKVLGLRLSELFNKLENRQCYDYRRN